MSAKDVCCDDEEYSSRVAVEHAADSGTQSSPLLASEQDDAALTTRTVSFTRYQGYFATPSCSSSSSSATISDRPPCKPIPCLIIIHEWWGLNAQIQAVTRQLASRGYHALAVDLYGKPAATDVKTARKYMKACFKVKEEYCMDCLKEAVKFLRNQHSSSPVGVLGWCLGGMFSLQLALTVPTQIQACVIFYGNPEPEREKLRALQAPILGIFGGQDRSISVDSVKAFEAELNELGKENEIYIYEGAQHAFCNPTGNMYQAEAAQDAWDKTVDFLELHLK